MRARELALILGALSLTPVLAYDAGSSNARFDTAAVAVDATSYVGVANLGPTAGVPVVLENHNGYANDAVTVTNGFASPVTMQATLTSNPAGRFSVSNPSVSLAAGASTTFRLQDNDQQHNKLCTSVTLQVDAFVGGTGGARTGHAVLSRQVFIEVRPTKC